MSLDIAKAEGSVLLGVSDNLTISKIAGTVLIDTNDNLSVVKIYATVLLDAGGICPYVAHYLPIPDVISTTLVNNVSAGVDNVVSASGVNNVIFSSTVRSRGARKTKYLAILPSVQNAPLSTYSFTYSFFKDVNFLDWFTQNERGTDAAAFLITGQETMQDTQRGKKVTYLTMHMERTETGFTGTDPLIAINESSVLVESRWEWANNTISGRFGKEFQAYRLLRNFIPDSATDAFNYGFEVITTRNKLRGKGRALSLKFSTEAGKDFKLLGWATNITGEEKV